MKKGVVAVGVGVNKETPTHISRAIIGFDATGPGTITNFRVNNKLVKKKLIFKQRVRLEHGTGLTSDGKLVKAIKKDDKWSMDTMSSAVCVNTVDRDVAYQLWLQDNPGRPIEEMPTS